MNDLAPIKGFDLINEANHTLYALQEFYQGFNNRDYSLIENNWSRHEQASLANPLGGLRRGWSDISRFYQTLFSSRASVFVEYHDYHIENFGQIFIAVGRERGYFSLDGITVNLAIRTSRCYRLEAGCWKQFHHHGSIEDPQLLLDYQTTVAKIRGE